MGQGFVVGVKGQGDVGMLFLGSAPLGLFWPERLPLGSDGFAALNLGKMVPGGAGFLGGPTGGFLGPYNSGHGVTYTI